MLAFVLWGIVALVAIPVAVFVSAVIGGFVANPRGLNPRGEGTGIVVGSAVGWLIGLTITLFALASAIISLVELIQAA